MRCYTTFCIYLFIIGNTSCTFAFSLFHTVPIAMALGAVHGATNQYLHHKPGALGATLSLTVSGACAVISHLEEQGKDSVDTIAPQNSLEKWKLTYLPIQGKPINDPGIACDSELAAYIALMNHITSDTTIYRLLIPLGIISLGSYIASYQGAQRAITFMRSRRIK